MPEPIETNESPENPERGSAVGGMHSRREQMADGRRYIVYYTFRENDEGEGGEDV